MAHDVKYRKAVKRMTNINRNYLDPSVRWTDKLTLCANGDIVEDFTGKIVGHITPNVEEADNE